MLCVGFYLHTNAIPVIQSNLKKENNNRDMFLGYALVLLTFLAIGIMGYIGFRGKLFDDYYQQHGYNHLIE